MTKKKRVSHLNYTLAGSSSNEQALDSNPNFIDDDEEFSDEDMDINTSLN